MNITLRFCLLVLRYFVVVLGFLSGFWPQCGLGQVPGGAPRYRVSGQVTEAASGASVAGATILLKNTQRGTITDANGNFSLDNVPSGNQTLDISFIGFKRVSYPLDVTQDLSDVRIPLEEDALGLETVVVTGQGIAVDKRRLSTNVTTITSKQIEQVPVPRIEQILQSQIPNAQVNFAAGQPGTTSLIRSRGVVSAFKNTTPVIYVDGVRVDNLNTFTELGLNISGNRSQGAATSALSDIPVENIERIEFINGGAATTLFGSDAANGVIQIFTKKGASGRVRLNVEAQAGAERATTDYYFFDRTAEILHQTGFFQQYRVSAEGGSDNVSYAIAGGMMRNTGSLVFNQNEQQRYDLRTSLSARLAPKVQYQGSFGFVNDQYRRVRNGNAGGYVGLWFTEAGASSRFGFAPNLDTLSDEAFATVRDFARRAEELQNNTIRVRRFQTSQGLEFKPLAGLTVRANAGLDYRNSLERGVVTSEYLIHTRATNTQGSISNYQRQFLSLTLELTGQYDLRVNDFSFLTTLGGQIFRNEDEQVAFIGQNVRDGALNIRGSTTTSDEFALAVANYGVYVQENVGFRDRYFVEFGLRADGNSAFGENIGLQYFPKGGFSYLISDEPFFRDLLGSRALSSLKLRANYGVAGNFPTPFTNQRTVVFNNLLGRQAATFGQPGNDDLRPEKTYTFEAGLETGLLDERLSLSVTYFNAVTRDALFDAPPAPTSGEQNQRRNLGEILNRGWEIAANAAIVRRQDWSVLLRGSFNTVYNEVLSAGEAPFFPIGGFSANTIQSVVQVGEPVGFLRGRTVVFGADGRIAEVIQQSNLGSTIPTSFGNLGLDISYKNRLNFFATADYQMGGVIHSFDRSFRVFHGLSDPEVPQPALDQLNEARTNSQILTNFTNIFVESSDFLKVRLMGINYLLPAQWLNTSVDRIQVGFTVMNPFNFYGSNFDPEATLSGAREQDGTTTGGLNYSTFSRPRQFIGSIKLRL